MDIDEMRKLSYDELRSLYRQFLYSQNIKRSTVDTAYSDTFYLWNKGSKDLFWNIVLSEHFLKDAKEALIDVLSRNSSVDANKYVSNYLSHLRRFRLFLSLDRNESDIGINIIQKKHRLRINDKKINVPDSCVEQIEHYLAKWDSLENYHLQENALNKLFFELCPKNTDIEDILLKASTLNDFYSTNIRSMYPVAKHIYELQIDNRLAKGDVTLVEDIKPVIVGNKIINNYSFASKYCSHHRPLDYPIYDYYVDIILRYFRDRDNFMNFENEELKDYVRFKEILFGFRKCYGLEQYNLKQIDQYIWQLGKEYFPRYDKKQSVKLQ